MEATRERPAEKRRPRSVRFVTFGCKVNQYDTQILRERALAAGAEESDEAAEVIVVNTCTVTGHGAALARKAVRRMAREHPGARIYVTGCYAVSDPEAAAALPGVEGVLGNEEKEELGEILGGPGPETPFIERTVHGLEGHTRAFVKVQDGCRLRCSYCIIPSVRPDLTSKSPDVAVAEVRDLVAAGHREIVLTGIHLGAYGRDDGRAGAPGPLLSLIRRILSETELARLRLSSLEANEVSEELIDLVAGEERLAPHLHLPLQSGSDAVLRAMRRRYRVEDFLSIVDRLRARCPDLAVSTDLITGFPGETDDDFEASHATMRRAAFMRTHVFRYSPRPGTPAAELPDPVPERVARERSEAADELGRELAERYVESLLGLPATALFEDRRERGMLTGLTEHYVRVFADGPDSLMGRMAPIRYSAPVPGGAEALL